MVVFKTILRKFGEQGEKTGWTYIEIAEEFTSLLKPGNRKGFRVKGKLDKYLLKSVAILPRGDGSFIMPINATMRKAIGKRNGAMVHVELSVDNSPQEISKDLLECLEDDPAAKTFFFNLAPSHRNYFSKWVDGIKSPELKAQRLADVIDALSRGWGFVEMRHHQKLIKGK